MYIVHIFIYLYIHIQIMSIYTYIYICNMYIIICSVYFKMRTWNLLLQCGVSRCHPKWGTFVEFLGELLWLNQICPKHSSRLQRRLLSKKLLNVAPLKHLKMKLFPKKLIYPLNIDGWKLEDDSFPFSFISRGGKPTHLFCWSIPRAIGIRPIPLVPFWVAWVLGIWNVWLG